MSWASVRETMAYFGVATLEELEEIVSEFDLDAMVHDDGRLLGVEGRDEMQEALFERHRRQVGHRPDDPVAHEAAVELHHAAVAEMKAQRKAKRKVLDNRVRGRKAAATRKAKEAVSGGASRT